MSDEPSAMIIGPDHYLSTVLIEALNDAGMCIVDADELVRIEDELDDARAALDAPRWEHPTRGPIDTPTEISPGVTVQHDAAGNIVVIEVSW